MGCSYCYLSDKNKKDVMSEEVAIEAFKFIVKNNCAKDQINILWHVGEPLTVPLSFYKSIFQKFEKICPPGFSFRFSFQTNGTCITDDWCEFFRETKSQVGVSIDGPKFIHDKYRHWKNKGGTFENVLEGIQKLKHSHIPFGIIAVLPLESLNYPIEIIDFLLSLNPTEIAFNIEETEGVHVSDSINNDIYYEKYYAFMKTVRELSTKMNTSKTIIREHYHLENFIKYGQEDRISDASIPFNIISIDTKGNLSTFSPELITMKHKNYNFVFGNIFQDSLADIINNVEFQKVHRSVKSGIKLCRDTCDYFTLCGGGAPSNKLYENHSFNSSETIYCKTNIKANADILLEELNT